MRVPIENGLGLFNQVSDFINLPAAFGTAFIDQRISNFPEAVSSSPWNTLYTYCPFFKPVSL